MPPNSVKKKKINLITFTGKSNNNRIKSINSKNMNFWVDSHAYNHIELAHLFLLLSTVDMIIGKSVYKA